MLDKERHLTWSNKGRNFGLWKERINDVSSFLLCIVHTALVALLSVCLNLSVISLFPIFEPRVNACKNMSHHIIIVHKSMKNSHCE
jgi:hypothetical protein